MKPFENKKPGEEQNPNVIGKSARPLYDKATFVKAIMDVLPSSPFLLKLKCIYNEGDLLLKENEKNNCLHIVLEGFVSQVKQGQEFDTEVDIQGPGDFIGLLSFQTGEPVFTTAQASTKVVTLRVDHSHFEIFPEKFPEINKTLQGLIFSNLAERYRRVVTLHVEVAQLSNELQKERNQLQKAIQQLSYTRNMLISQEKMATLGELTAGLAHEINNPASALLRSVDYLCEFLPSLAARAAALPDSGLIQHFFETGMQREMSDTATQRHRINQLKDQYPSLTRAQLRVLAEMHDEILKNIRPFMPGSGDSKHFQLFLDAYQAGMYLNGIRLSTSRIEHLVKSLKSYSRNTGSEPELADIRPGIRETLLITGNRLKEVEVKLDLPEIPKIMCRVGELNQVWTNIILNACDAMQNRGELMISCDWDQPGKKVWVKIADTGPGVPDKYKKKIFSSNFTTKAAGGEFGLGIGLAISKGIVEKHLGTIHVEDRPGGGAMFIVELPVETFV